MQPKMSGEMSVSSCLVKAVLCQGKSIFLDICSLPSWQKKASLHVFTVFVLFLQIERGNVPKCWGEKRRKTHYFSNNYQAFPEEGDLHLVSPVFRCIVVCRDGVVSRAESEVLSPDIFACNGSFVQQNERLNVRQTHNCSLLVPGIFLAELDFQDVGQQNTISAHISNTYVKVYKWH